MSTAEQMKRLAQYGVATVYEGLGRTGLVDAEFHQIIPGSSVAGPARTVRCGQGDNLMVHAVVEQIQAGEILVLTMEEPEAVALIGDLLVTQIAVKGAAGILVDAAVRDVDELKKLGLPIWTRFIRVKGAKKNIAGELNGTVTVGGQNISSGDFVVMDTDGVTVVPKDRLEEALEKAEARTEREEAMRARLKAGEISFDIHGLRAKLAELQGGS